MEVKIAIGKHKNLETNYHEGLVPDTFDGLKKSKITFLHIDLDMYVSLFAPADWTYTRLVSGVRCFVNMETRQFHGAKKATDEFLADKPEKPVFPFANWAGFVHKNDPANVDKSLRPFKLKVNQEKLPLTLG